MKDYYDILGITRSADQEEIKRAYRSMARRHHPDVSQGGGDGGDFFKEINEAYEVLSNPERKRRYDLFGEEGSSPAAAGSGFDVFGGPIGDIFNMFFGRGPGRADYSPQRGSDLLTVVTLTLSEAYTGTLREIELPRTERCEECGGTGLAKGYSHDICPQCGGEGKTVHTRRSALGTFTSTTVCSRCGGTGEINTHPCPSCGGEGAKQIVDRFEVNMPAGVDNGDRIRMNGRGEAGLRGGPPGDLYVEVRISEHDIFTRHGSDLHAMVSIDMSEAALGTDIDVTTLNGQEKLQIPAGSQPGEVFKLRGKGMPSVRSRSLGDLYLTLEVKVPKKLSAEQKILLHEFKLMEDEKMEKHGIMSRLRKAMGQDY
jgi:molecular chaperone DnaJ